MRKILQIRSSARHEQWAQLLNSEPPPASQPVDRVRFDLLSGSPDYNQLLDEIFAADAVQVL